MGWRAFSSGSLTASFLGGGRERERERGALAISSFSVGKEKGKRKMVSESHAVVS